MQFEDNRMYRVKAVAEALDVSVATIYRAIESGKLDALKIGTGKGTLRITGQAANVYVNGCAEAAYQAYVVEGSSAAASDDPVGDGRACVVCRVDFLRSGNSHVPVGHSDTGSQVFACLGRCERAAQGADVEGNDMAGEVV